MADLGRPKVRLELSGEEREQLERWARRRKSAQALAQRSRIVLGCASGAANIAVAARERVSAATVGKWRGRFVRGRLDGLVDEPRAGRPRTIDDAKVEEVIVRTLETEPKDATHWSTRSMAAEAGLSREAVGRIWRAFGLQPHRVETWKLSRDPLFIDKVRDLCGLYLAPPERAVVLCVDEQSQIQALDRTAPILPLRPGIPQRQTHDLQTVGHLEPVRGAGPDDRQGSSTHSGAATARSSSSSSSSRSTRRSRPTSTSTWSSTTPRPIRPRPSSAG